MNQTTQQTLSDFNLIESMLDFVVKLSDRHIDIAHIPQYHNELNSIKIKLYNINLDNLTDTDKKRHADLKAAILREIDTFNILAARAIAESVNILRAEHMDILFENDSETIYY